ncbi:hypothetical protein H5410_013356 [Solanum commersonii]|uniref:Uncharacterized protein n=1 Tax=Solanum commersonii TaxID=4109 RepID=A0A9J6AV76_SOLCO|nr:hypothetical protein H5410_013356 [Solanum commersonii]
MVLDEMAREQWLLNECHGLQESISLGFIIRISLASAEKTSNDHIHAFLDESISLGFVILASQRK